MKRITGLCFIAILICVAICAMRGAAHAQTVYVPLQVALDAMVSDSQVTVSTVATTWGSDPKFYYEFKKAGTTPTAGFVFYPGANVDERAYAPICRRLALEGFFVALIPMPSYYANLGQNRADRVILNHPEVTTWSIGGHSFGAVGACWYITGSSMAGAGTQSSKIKNLVLVASYPDTAYPLTAKPVKVLSLWGTNDGFITSTKIDASKPYLPADTVYTAMTGANHSQDGYYGTTSTDYSFIQPPVNGDGPPDNAAGISREAQLDLIVNNTSKFLNAVPPALQTITADDGSVWERISNQGFGNTNNMSVVALQGYKGHLYALTRNQVQGCEIWRTTGTGWEQVLFPNSATNGIYGNPWINNLWARMIVFNDKLYFGFSSGQQGTILDSTGCEIWNYDGVNWTPVISDKTAGNVSGTITAISGCVANDGDPTAVFTDSSKSWTTNQWAGGYISVNTAGAGKIRKYRIVSNTSNTLTVQQNERAGSLNASTGVDTEFTTCASKTFSNPFPVFSYTVDAVTTGLTYEICYGTNKNGFGQPWNKTITAMKVFNNILYVSTGLNYDYGAQVWYSGDGINFYPTTSKATEYDPQHSFGNYHNDGTYPGGKKPVSSSITDLVVSSVSGTPTLYAGGTGTSGDTGGCSRMSRFIVVTDTNDPNYSQCQNGCWELIVDNDVDANTTGTNENGFGAPPTCYTNAFNFMPWALIDFNNLLMTGISTGWGARVLYATVPAGGSIKDDGVWHYSVGQADTDPDTPGWVDPLGTSSYPDGFDGYKYSDGNYQNLAANFGVISGKLWAGTVTQYVPSLTPTIPPNMSELHGSQMWTTTDGHTWHQVTSSGLGDATTVQFEAFTDYNGLVYVSGSKASSAAETSLGGAQIYRMVQGPPAVDSDGDGILDSIDNCPSVYNPLQLDADGDGIGDSCDLDPGCGGCGTPLCEYQIGTLQDTDGDLWPDTFDNCPNTYNPNQTDHNHNGIGDCCDPTPGCGGCGQVVCDTLCSKP